GGTNHGGSIEVLMGVSGGGLDRGLVISNNALPTPGSNTENSFNSGSQFGSGGSISISVLAGVQGSFGTHDADVGGLNILSSAKQNAGSISVYVGGATLTPWQMVANGDVGGDISVIAGSSVLLNSLGSGGGGTLSSV